MKVERSKLGMVPVMVRSRFCSLSNLEAKERMESRECVYDEGGYFIVNGGEKVLVAQERMANNFVYVFQKKQPSKYRWVAEIRSQAEQSSRPPSQFSVKALSKGGQFAGPVVNAIRCSIPYIKEDVPVVLLFRALGLLSDRDILSRISYSANDRHMMEAMRPSLEEAAEVKRRDDALDFIGRRGNTVGATRAKRIKFASDILDRELLPHVSTESGGFVEKAYFIGYMVHRLISAALGRSSEDDRDHYGKKRVDLSGALLSGLFRQLFRKFTKDAQMVLKRQLDETKGINIIKALKPTTITRGLRYGLATGNWGTNRAGQVSKTGVSQSLNRLTYSASLSHLRRLNTPL